MTPNLQRVASASVAEASAQFGVSVDCIVSRCRDQQEAYARHAVATALRSLGISFAVIGSLIDRDHGTVMNSVKKCRWRCGYDRSYKVKCDAINVATREAYDGRHEVAAAAVILGEVNTCT